jgi:hypothetical protein
LIVLAIPPVLTAKAEVAAVVEESASSYVRITLVPLALVAAEAKVGDPINPSPFGIWICCVHYL